MRTQRLHQVAMFIALVSLLTIMPGCKTLDSLLAGAPKPSASLKDVRFDSLSWDKLALKFDVEVTNPYSLPLPLVNMDYGLSGGASQFLSGKANFKDTTIPANGSQTVTLPAEVNLAEVINFVKGVRPGSAMPYSANLNLSVDAPQLGPITLPLSRKGELKVPSIPGAAGLPGLW